MLIALAAVGRESFTLGSQPKQTNFDLQEAVDFVADRLPDELTAHLTYDDVASLLRWHLEYLNDRGVPTRRDLNRGGPVVIEDDEGVAFVLMRADADGLDVTDEEVTIVLDQELAYLEAIGAVGGEVADPLSIDPGAAPPSELAPPDSGH